MQQASTKNITKPQHLPPGFSGTGFDSNHAHWAGDRKPLAPGAKANESDSPWHPAAPGGTRHLYQPSPEEEGKEVMDIDRRSKSPSSALKQRSKLENKKRETSATWVCSA